MRFENDTSEFELTAKAIRAISREMSREGLARVFLKADTSFPREGAKFFVSESPAGDFGLLPELCEPAPISRSH
jgi:hypothetical protein